MRGMRRHGRWLGGLAAALVLVLASPNGAWAASPREMQWYLDALHVPAAQQISNGQGVVVGVVDSGVDAGNPDLAGRLLPGKSVDFNRPDAGTDTDGHGTAMIGIIAGNGAGGGALGVAPGSKVLPVRSDTDLEATLPSGIKYAVEHGAKVINVSASGQGTSAYDMREALQDAFNHDVVVVAGAGNVSNGQSQIGLPANYPGVVAVTGTDKSGNFWPGSVQGPEAAVAAPAVDGVSVASRQSPDAQRGYRGGDGTSNSTAIVSGVVALIRAKYPNLNAASVINRLIRTADDKGPAGRDPQYGFGVVDPVEALTANVPSVTQNPLAAASSTNSPSGSNSGAHNGGGGTNAAAHSSGPSAGAIVGLAAVLAVIAAAIVIAVIMVRRRAKASTPT